MHLKLMTGTIKRALWSLAVTGMLMYGGGCSLKSIGASFLSELLTSGTDTATTTGATTDTGLSGLLGQLLGAAT